MLPMTVPSPCKDRGRVVFVVSKGRVGRLPLFPISQSFLNLTKIILTFLKSVKNFYQLFKTHIQYETVIFIFKS